MRFFNTKEEKMKVLREVVQDCNEGLPSLMDKKVILFCANYFYTGLLVEVNKTCVKLENPSIVYETGSFSDSAYKDAQSLNVKHWYVRLGAIESFGESK